MRKVQNAMRFLVDQAANHLKRPPAKIQPILAKKGEATIDTDKLAKICDGCAVLERTIVIDSAEHWEKAVRALDDTIDVILPMSIPAYPTEVWNSHPQPLIDRKLPVLFWPLMKYDEPDFWRWSAKDFLTAVGVEVHIAKNTDHAVLLLKSLAVRRFLRSAKIVVFGEQNFPWNAHAAGHLVAESLGTNIVVKPISEIRTRYAQFSDDDVSAVWSKRKSRYIEESVEPDQLQQAIRIYLSVRSVLEQEGAVAFGVNCFGDLVIKGGRDVPCLAQLLLREDGYVTACDGDFIAIMSILLMTLLLDKPCMMSNMYPVSYVGALEDHFGDSLAPDAKRYPKTTWKDLARLAHCGFVGIVSPEMTAEGKVCLTDWGGTYEIKRDGKGCGIDADLAPGQQATVVELCFPLPCCDSGIWKGSSIISPENTQL